MTQTPTDSETPPLPTTVYRPDYRRDLSFVQTLAVMARNIWTSREMVFQLLKRDVTAQYKKSFIGVSWIMAGPIMAVIPWIFASKVNVYNPGEMIIPLTVYLVVGRSMWSLFTGFYAAASNTLGGGSLMQQVNFPHEAMLCKNTINGLINFSLSFVTTIVVMLVFKVYPGWHALLFPLTLLPLFFLGASLGLIVAMIRVVAYDLDRMIGILMGFLMWTTPLLYSDKHPPHPVLQLINDYNPLTYLVCTCRDVLIHGTIYADAYAVYFSCAGITFMLFLVSLRLFFITEHKLVERMV